MALVALRPLLGRRRGAIDLVVVDAIIEETHNRSSQVTQHPVQQSTPVSDHIIRDPETVTMSCQISDYQQNIGTFQRLSRFFSFLRPSQQAFEYLNFLWQQKQLITVVSSLKVYRDMAISEIEFKRSFETSNVLRFDITLQKIVRFCQPEPLSFRELDPLINELKDLRSRVTKGRLVALDATAQVENTAVDILRGLP